MSNLIDEIDHTLRNLNATSDSIKGAANNFLDYGDLGRETIIVDRWDNYFRTLDKNQHGDILVYLLFVANHILQSGRKRQCWPNFVSDFGRILPGALRKAGSSEHQVLQMQARKILKVWEENQVFSAEQVVKLNQAFTAGDDAGPEKVPENFVAPPIELVNLAQTALNLNEWSEKTKQKQSKIQELQGTAGNDPNSAEYRNLFNDYEKAMKNQEMFRVNFLQNATDVFKSMDNVQMKYILAYRKITNLIEKIESVERDYA